MLANTYLLPGVPTVGEAVNGLARKGLTLTMFFIGASLSLDTLRQVGLKPAGARGEPVGGHQPGHAGVYLFDLRKPCYRPCGRGAGRG